MLKWVVELDPNEINCEPRRGFKCQAFPDFIAKCLALDEPMGEDNKSRMLHVDRSTTNEANRVGGDSSAS